MKNSALIRSFCLISVTILTSTAVLAQQDNSAEGRLRAANAQILRLRAQMYTAGAGEQGSNVVACLHGGLPESVA